MSASLTTLQLIDAISEAVVDVLDADCHTTQSACREAVAYVLEANGVWFCRVRETDQGTKMEQMEIWPQRKFADSQEV